MDPQKKLQMLSLGTLFFVAIFVESNALAAKATKAEKIAAQETITGFLYSVELASSSYDFDFDSDGVAEMVVYPLITSEPDLETMYFTLEEALKNKQVVVREDSGIKPSKSNPQGQYPIVAQMYGYRTGGGSRYGGSRYGGSRYGSGGGGGTYYSRGSMTGGGYQNRGLGRGGTLGYNRGYQSGGGYNRRYQGGGGYNRGYQGGQYYNSFNRGAQWYNGRPGNTRPGGFGLNDNSSQAPDPENTVVAGGSASEDVQLGSSDRYGLASQGEMPEFTLDALCFEKWRLIEESRLRGDPEHFAYAGMASPLIRKELIEFPNQMNIHNTIRQELMRLGVYSATEAFTDVFKDPVVNRVIDYYVSNSKKIVAENKGISGIVIAGKNGILCADVYSSPSLFKKMLAQLMQSAALGVYHGPDKIKKHSPQNQAANFLDDLKRLQTIKKESPQSYRLLYPKMISAAEIDNDDKGMRLLHLEAYPR